MLFYSSITYFSDGLALSSDEKKLYIGDLADNKVYVFDIAADGSISNKKLFATVVGHDAKYNVTDIVDGICTDSNGNVFINGAPGLYVYQADGTRIGYFDNAGVHVTNCYAGGDGYLYVTTLTELKRVKYIKKSNNATSLTASLFLALLVIAMNFSF